MTAARVAAPKVATSARGPGDGERAGPQRLGVGVEQDPAVVDEQHVLEQVADLLDQVGGEDDGPRVLGVVGEQPVVEELPGDGVQPEVRLVEQGERRPGGQPEDDADRGASCRGRAS